MYENGEDAVHMITEGKRRRGSGKCKEEKAEVRGGSSGGMGIGRGRTG